jgi:NAD(P)H-flavin reductase
MVCLCSNIADDRNTLSCPPKDGSWKDGVGRIDPSCLKAQFGATEGKTMVLVCGPPGMCDAVKQWCDEEGWDLEKDLVVF